MTPPPEHEPPADFADRVDTALRALWSGDSTGFERLLESEGAAGPRLGGLYDEELDRHTVSVVGLTSQSEVPGYKIIREIGRGGMGIVYEAEQQDPRRHVALKVLRAVYADEQHVKLFRREIQSLARLTHSAIATIYEAGRTEEGQHFFTMELVDGVPLTAYVRDAELLLRGRLELFLKICQPVQYAHECDVIHRDLKPSNIMVDAEGNPKILDFGLARIVDPEATQTYGGTGTGKIFGTLAYMSPEQARGKPDEVDARSDIYGLGVILYELLTGQLPYQLSKLMPHEAARIICEEAPPKPSTINHALRGDVETILLKALEREPARRYQSASELGEDIDRYLNGEPILARPPSSFYVLRKKLSKHRAWVAVAAVAVALGLIGLWGGSWWGQLSTDRRLRDESVAEARRDALMACVELEQGNTQAGYGTAIDYFKQYRDLPEIRLLYARALFQGGMERSGEQRAKKFHEAVSRLEDVPQGDPWQWVYDFLVAEICEAAWWPKKAEEARRRAKPGATETAEAWYLRSLATIDLETARDCVSKALDRDRKHTLAWARQAFLCLQAGDLDGASASMEQVVRLAPNDVEWRLRQARILLEQGDYRTAIAKCADLVRLTPESIWAYHYRACACLCIKNYEQAVQDYDSALRIDPALYWFYYYRATPLWILGRLKEAERDYRALRSRMPIHHYADARLFFVLSGQNRRQEAEKMLAAARRNVGQEWQGKILACLAGEIAPEDLVDAAESVGPPNRVRLCEGYYYAGEVCLLYGDTEKAREWFQKCVETDLVFDPGTGTLVVMNEYHLARWRLDQLTSDAALTSSPEGE